MPVFDACHKSNGHDRGYGIDNAYNSAWHTYAAYVVGFWRMMTRMEDAPLNQAVSSLAASFGADGGR